MGSIYRLFGIKPQIICVVVAIAAGCVGEPETVYIGEGPDWKDYPRVAHPDYVHWSQFPVGTYVVREKQASNENGTVEVTTRIELVSLTDDRVELTQQVTIQDASGVDEKPAQPLSFPATFPMPPEMEEKQFLLPSLKADLTGEDELEIGDQTFVTQVYEWEEVNEAGPMPVKYWQSNEVPGRLVRQEARILSNSDEIIEYVSEFRLAPRKSKNLSDIEITN